MATAGDQETIATSLLRLARNAFLLALGIATVTVTVALLFGWAHSLKEAGDGIVLGGIVTIAAGGLSISRSSAGRSVSYARTVGRESTSSRAIQAFQDGARAQSFVVLCIAAGIIAGAIGLAIAAL